MIQLYECPRCGRDSAAYVKIDGLEYCPACAPTPDKEPHDYKPVLSGCDPQLATKALRTGGVVKLTDAQAREILFHGYVVPAYVRNNVCCLDPGDCSGPCGLA